MPTRARELAERAGLRIDESVPWGQPPAHHGAGVYLISLSSDPDSLGHTLPEAPILDSEIGQWLDRVPALKLDGKASPSIDAVACRLKSFWLPDENVLYVGKAASLARRLNQFFKHRLGYRRPHAGGHWLKTLRVLDSLTLHVCRCATDGAAIEVESRMLMDFQDRVSGETLERLYDRERPYPFANMEWHTDGRKPRKRHGFRRCTIKTPILRLRR